MKRATKTFICLTAIALALTACRAQPPAPAPAALAPATASAATQKLIVDVRTAQEFASGHIEGAINIPYDEIGARIAAVAPSKDREIVLYCRSGARSNRAFNTLNSLGYTNVMDAGDINELRAKLAQKSIP